MRGAGAGVVVMGALGILVGPAGPVEAREPSALSISVPPGASLGSTAPGQTLSAQLGQVTVSGGASEKQAWSATVALTGQFTVTQSGQTWTFPAARVSYWAGAGTGALLGTLTCPSGQPTALTAQNLTAPRTAYSCPVNTNIVSTAWSLSWNPTLVVATQATDPAGTYSGTITHSVV